jgi:putative acetyltransferase
MTHALETLGILVLGTRFRVLSEQMMALVKGFYDQHGLAFEPRCFPVFQFVRETPGISLVALSQKLGVSHVSVNALCKPLLEAGLIDLKPNPEDARAKQASLTEAGEVMFTRLQPAWHALKSALEEALTPAQANALLATLSALDEVIEDNAIQRGLKSALSPAHVADRLRLVPYIRDNAEHRRYFAALNIEWLETWFTVEDVDREMFADPEGLILDQGGDILMAMVDDQIVGTGALIRRTETVYELAKMAVSRPYQGKGIGVKLVDALTDLARTKGLQKLYLVSSTKLPHAVPMYKKLGFSECMDDIGAHYVRADITLEKAI